LLRFTPQARKVFLFENVFSSSPAASPLLIALLLERYSAR
jgi:hypothetical protein